MVLSHLHTRKKLLLLLYLRRKLRRPRKRLFWVRPSISLKERKMFSAYFHLNKKQKTEEKEPYKNYFRLTPEQFDCLLIKVTPLIEKYSFREPISPAERLALTLRFLASGDSMTSVANNYRVAKNTVSKIIRETCKSIWTVLWSEVFPQNLNSEYWESIAKDFQNQWNMPHCTGSIDGKHISNISIQAPPNSGSDFYNYKGFHSLILMGVSDANYKFTYIDLGAQGRQSDGGIFRKTDFYKKLKADSLGLPKAKHINGIKIPLPYYFVGDAAFPLLNNLMWPFPGRFLNRKKSVFNYRLSRARRVIENTFGILAARWRIFRRSIIASVETVEFITLACVCLHNWLIAVKNIGGQPNNYFSVDFIDDKEMDGQLIWNQWRSDEEIKSITGGRCNVYTRSSAEIRDVLADYFISGGAVPFQWDK